MFAQRCSFFTLLCLACLGGLLLFPLEIMPSLLTQPGKAPLPDLSVDQMSFSDTQLYDWQIDQADFENALYDRDKLISTEFQIPPGLEKAVSFWLSIYTKYSTHQVVLFDSHYPEVVYEVLDFTDNHHNSKSRLIYEVVRKNTLAKKIKRYKNAFKSLKRNPHPKKPTPEQLNILSALKAAGLKKDFGVLSRSMRSQTGQRENILFGLERAAPYWSKMEKIFSNIGVPIEITRLSLLESSFNNAVTSSAGARGVWQFIKTGAKDFLVVDEKLKLDERLSILKSTAGAARLLRRNYFSLNSWPLALTAYNYGVRPLIRIPHRLRSHSHIAELYKPSRKKARLGFAGRSYFPGFLAVLRAEKYRELFYPKITGRDNKPAIFKKITKTISVRKFSKLNGITPEALIGLNSDIRSKTSLLPKNFHVLVPANLNQDNSNLLASPIYFRDFMKANGLYSYAGSKSSPAKGK